MADGQQLARQAFRRDVRLGIATSRIIKARYADEAPAVVVAVAAGRKPRFDVGLWQEALLKVWLAAVTAVYDDTFRSLTGVATRSAVEMAARRPVAAGGKQVQRLVALVEDVLRTVPGRSAVQTFTRDAANGVITSSRRRIATVVSDLPVSDTRRITQALRHLYSTEFATDRASRLALQNVMQATATAEFHAAQEAERVTGRVYEQAWRNQGDGNVRDTHTGVATVLVGEFFSVGGSQLRYPRDPQGPPAEVANCRCWAERKQRRQAAA